MPCYSGMAQKGSTEYVVPTTVLILIIMEYRQKNSPMAFYKKKTNYKNNKKMNWIERLNVLSGRNRTYRAVRRRILRELEICPATFYNWRNGASAPTDRQIEIINSIISDPIYNPKDADSAAPVVPADILASPQK